MVFLTLLFLYWPADTKNKTLLGLAVLLLREWKDAQN